MRRLPSTARHDAVPFVSLGEFRGRCIPRPVLPNLPALMLIPTLWCLTAFLLLFTALLSLRARLEASRSALDTVALALED